MKELKIVAAVIESARGSILTYRAKKVASI